LLIELSRDYCTVKMTPLSLQQITEKAAALNECWTCKTSVLQGKFAFKDFSYALNFVNAVGKIAEKQQHHPSIQLDYNQVVVECTTHEAGNKLTPKDFQLATAIDRLSL